MEVKSLAANSAAVVLAVLFGSAPAGLAMESDTSPAPLSEEGWCAGALHLIVRAGRDVRVSLGAIFSHPSSCRPVATGRKCQSARRRQGGSSACVKHARGVERQTQGIEARMPSSVPCSSSTRR